MAGPRRTAGRRWLVVAGAVVGFWLALVGPWPTYGPHPVTEQVAFRRALAELDRQLPPVAPAAAGHLRAGWGERTLEPPFAVPLAGYGDRDGAPATGVHDPPRVQTLVLEGGGGRLAVVVADLLIVPENLAEAARREIARRTPLTAAEILFNATHTHSGPGAWAPGWAAQAFAGPYDPRLAELVVAAMAEATEVAWRRRAPATLRFGATRVPEHVENRSRPRPVDPWLDVAVVETAGDRCTLVRYSAHATVLRAGNLLLSGDYPAFLRRRLEAEAGGMAIFLAGAVGSVGPVPPALTEEGLTVGEDVAASGEAFAAAEALGTTLARRVLATATSEPTAELDVAAVGFAFDAPPRQLRLSRRWRLSPWLAGYLGVDGDGWLHVARVGKLVLAAFPGDYSGELGLELRKWGAAQGLHLWPLSFNGDYLGYLSPDREYDRAFTETVSRRARYETVTMSWAGPDQEAFFDGLVRAAVERLTSERAPERSPERAPEPVP